MKHPVPDRVKPSVISNFCGHSGVQHRMLYSCQLPIWQ